MAVHHHRRAPGSNRVPPSQPATSPAPAPTTCNAGFNQRQPYPCSNPTYGYNTYQRPYPSFEASPLGPPPPYQMYHEPQVQVQPAQWQQQQRPPQQPAYTSQPYLPVNNPSRNKSNVPQPWASSYSLAPQQPQQVQQKQGWQSSFNLVPLVPLPAPVEDTIARRMNQGAAFCDNVAARLHDIFAEIEGSSRTDEEVADMVRELSFEEENTASAAVGRSEPRVAKRSKPRPGMTRERPNKSGLINFKKTWMYANSRLPPHLPPLTVYMSTWRLLCMAAKASMEVYNRPSGAERDFYVDADWRNGTKAMVLKTTPIDDRNLIVFAVRGSKKNVVDWSVNFRPAPTAPINFLDDDGNACHAGFLAVARAMIAPVAARLRNLLQQDPSRASSSLLITGHSAGGAVASLLFMHMLSTTVESELNILTGCFKRVHCVTFGAPPVSFLPLQKPSSPRFAKSVFISFANEGDPIVRAAGKAYFISWAKLLAAPAIGLDEIRVNMVVKKASRARLLTTKSSKMFAPSPPPPVWSVPPASLSNAGRVVLLREKPGSKQRTVEAVYTSDDALRGIIFGDLAMHEMSLYKQRVKTLAIAAVTGDRPG